MLKPHAKIFNIIRYEAHLYGKNMQAKDQKDVDYSLIRPVAGYFCVYILSNNNPGRIRRDCHRRVDPLYPPLYQFAIPGQALVRLALPRWRLAGDLL
jgi:hypothetical protein